MPKFRYLAYNSTGDRESGEIEASSARDALNALNDRGLVPYSAEPSGENRRSPHRLFGIGKPGKLNLSDYAEMTRELSVLLTAGLPLDESLRLLSVQSGHSKVSRLASKLHESVVGGSSLSEAMNRHTIDAPTSLASLVHAGEARGSLASTLTELARFFERRVELQEQIRSALLYPAVLGVIALGAIAVVLAFLVPALEPLFNNAGAEVPLSFRIASSASALLASQWPVLLAALFGVVLLTRAVLRTDGAQVSIHRFVLRAPFLSRVVTTTHVATLARTLGTLLANGVPLVSALSITSQAVANRYLSQTLRNAAEAVKEGKKLSGVLDEAELVPKHAVRFVAIGEESSNLHGMLLHLAEISQKDAQRSIERAMTLLTPILTIVLGILVGSLILSVMQAVLSVNELIIR